MFLAFATGYAETLGADEIYYGPNADDNLPYPDCRPSFVQAFQQVINVATAQAVNATPPTLVTPLLRMNKVEIIKHGDRLNIPFELTLSCYDPTPLAHHCGICDACILRKDGFVSAGRADPSIYKIQHIYKVGR